MTLDPVELAKIRLNEAQQQSILSEAKRLKQGEILPVGYTYQGVDGATGRAILRSSDGGELREREVISSGGIPLNSRIAKKGRFVDAVPGVVPAIPVIRAVTVPQNLVCPVLYEKLIPQETTGGKVELWLGGDRDEPLLLSNYTPGWTANATDNWYTSGVPGGGFGTWIVQYNYSQRKFEFNQNSYLTSLLGSDTYNLRGNLTFEVFEPTNATCTLNVASWYDTSGSSGSLQWSVTLDDGADVAFTFNRATGTGTATVTLAPGVHNFNVNFEFVTTGSGYIGWDVNTSIKFTKPSDNSFAAVYPFARYNYLAATKEEYYIGRIYTVRPANGFNPLNLSLLDTYYEHADYITVQVSDSTIAKTTYTLPLPGTPVTLNPSENDWRSWLFSFAFADNVGFPTIPSTDIFGLPPAPTDKCFGQFAPDKGANIVNGSTLYSIDLTPGSAAETSILAGSTTSVSVDVSSVESTPTVCNQSGTSTTEVEVKAIGVSGGTIKLQSASTYSTD